MEKTIKSYLRHRFGSMKYYCTDFKPGRDKELFAGRGIKCRFTADSFVDYVMNILGIEALEQVKDLIICRIDRDGHFEPGNIHLVSKTEHEKARREVAERYWANHPDKIRPYEPLHLLDAIATLNHCRERAKVGQ